MVWLSWRCLLFYWFDSASSARGLGFLHIWSCVGIIALLCCKFVTKSSLTLACLLNKNVVVFVRWTKVTWVGVAVSKIEKVLEVFETALSQGSLGWNIYLWRKTYISMAKTSDENAGQKRQCKLALTKILLCYCYRWNDGMFHHWLIQSPLPQNQLHAIFQ